MEVRRKRVISPVTQLVTRLCTPFAGSGVPPSFPRATPCPFHPHLPLASTRPPDRRHLTDGTFRHVPAVPTPSSQLYHQTRPHALLDAAAGALADTRTTSSRRFVRRLARKCAGNPDYDQPHASATALASSSRRLPLPPRRDALKAKPSPPLKLSTLRHTAVTAALFDAVNLINVWARDCLRYNSNLTDSRAREWKESMRTSAFAAGSGWAGWNFVSDLSSHPTGDFCIRYTA
ncbi:hypothetical protein R3P38DRAFT_3185047 [Favolaschia claudopus]|uniref:Uncharacterized protein n=1 Tax=Favolaschia claudopus TaxID=2862362 RepID=A0AAW0C655_9AGAR